jgi:hypothetical protein
VASLAQSVSLKELPNLPGYRKNVMTGRRTAATRAGTSDAGSLAGSPSRGAGGYFDDGSVAGGSVADDHFSLASYFEDPAKFQDMKEFNKSIQAFPVESGAYNDTSGRYSLRSQMRDRVTRTRALPYSSLDEAPHFVANSKAPVCRVLAYFMEAAPMNLLEPERARKVEIIFHLEDNTMEIIEPYIPNCGIMQGKMLKRHRVPKPVAFKHRSRYVVPPRGHATYRPLLSFPAPPTLPCPSSNRVSGEMASIGTGHAPDTEYYSVTDVHAGARLVVYQREYTVIDCDASTKRLLQVRHY